MKVEFIWTSGNWLSIIVIAWQCHHPHMIIPVRAVSSDFRFHLYLYHLSEQCWSHQHRWTNLICRQIVENYWNGEIETAFVKTHPFDTNFNNIYTSVLTAAGNIFGFENLGLGDIHRLLHPESLTPLFSAWMWWSSLSAGFNINRRRWVEKPTLECLSPMPEADSRAAWCCSHHPTTTLYSA